MTYLDALAFTIGIEVPVVALLFPGQRLRMAIASAIATTATHFTMHKVLPNFTSSFEQNVLAGETLAVVVEALVFVLVSRSRDVARSMLAAGLANGLSYSAGLLLQWRV